MPGRARRGQNGRHRSLVVLIVLAATPSCTIGFNIGVSPTPSVSVATPSASESSSPSASPSHPAAPVHCREPLSGFRLAFHSQNGVSDGDVADVARGAREARSYFRAQVPECEPVKVTVQVLNRSKGNIAAQTHVSDTPVQSHISRVPVFRIVVFANGPAWERTPPAFRSIIMLHEWYHVLEFSFLLCGPPACQELRGHVPDWLVEGAAVYESLQAADGLHMVFYSLTRQTQIRIAATDDEPLSRLTSITSPGSSYSLAFAAVELLVTLGGRSSLERFWRVAGATGGWKGAFQRAFHLSIDAFYRRFAAYRARGFRR